MPFVKRTHVKTARPKLDVPKIFVGRTSELHSYIEYILTPEDPLYNIISISGEGGVGKSTLLERFIEEAHSPQFREYCLTSIVDEHQTTPYSVMEKFAQQLSDVGSPLPEFEKALNLYKETVRKLQAEKDAAKETAVRETIDLVGSVVEEVPAVGGVIHKGANVITELYLKERHLRQMLKDAALLEDPISDLTQIFVEDLNLLTDKQIMLSSNRIKRQQRVILFFDTFEQLADEIAPWLLDRFLQANIGNNIVIIIAGRDSIEHSPPNDPKRWLRYRDQGVLNIINLNSFTEIETSDYLMKRGINDPKEITRIWQLSKGLPLYLGLLTFNHEMGVDPTTDVVANFLRWIPENDHIKRKLALDAALFSRSFSRDDFSAFPYLSNDEKTPLYSWLIGLPFVRCNPQDGRYRYHELAQEMFRRHLYQRSQQEYYTTRRNLATYYQGLLNRILELSANKAYTSSEEVDVALALANQLFYLPDETSHFAGIENVLRVFRYSSTEQNKEIIRFLRDLPHEQQINKVSENGLDIAKMLLQFIESQTEDRLQKLVAAANRLIKQIIHQAGFSSIILAWIYKTRANAYYALKDYQRAIQDFDHAIELNPSSALYYRNRGLTYQSLKDYQRAIQDFDRAIELNPSYATAYNNRGLTYQSLEDYQRAIQDFNRAIELNPSYTAACNNRGLAYQDLEDHQRAIQDFNRAIELDATYTWAYNNKANSYRGLKDYPLAIENFDRAIELNPAYAGGYNNRGIVYRELKDYQRAIQDYDRALELDPSYAGTHNNRGLVYHDLKDYQRAIQDFDRAIELNPLSNLYYRNRGLVYRDLKDYQRAIQDFDRAIELDPSYAAAHSSRGLVYRDLKDYQRAIQDFDRAIELDHSYTAAYRGLGLVYAEMNDYQCAIQNFSHAIELDPSHAGTYNNRGLVYRELKDNQRAIQDFDCAIELNPSDAAAFNNRGVTYRDLDDYQRAIQDYDRAIELNPLYATAYHNRGIAYRNLDDYPLAIENFDRAIELNPAYAGGYNNRGLVYRELKNYQRAIQDFDHALELDPSDASTYNNRGLAYQDLDDNQRAIQDFDRAVELNPSNAVAYDNRSELYRLLGNYEQALIDINSALTFEETEKASLYNNRGLILSYLERYEEAIKDYERGLKEEPDDIYILYNIAVVMIRWKGFPYAQTYFTTARNALLALNDESLLLAKLYGLGGLSALIREIDQALDYLQQAILQSKKVIGWARHDIAWLDLCDDLRFRALTTSHDLSY